MYSLMPKLFAENGGPYNFDTVQIDDVIKSSAKNIYSVIFPM